MICWVGRLLINRRAPVRGGFATHKLSQWWGIMIYLLLVDHHVCLLVHKSRFLQEVERLAAEVERSSNIHARIIFGQPFAFASSAQ